MGLLSEGSPLSWEDTRDLAEHVRREGITQFINLYHNLKDRTGDGLKWGDEVNTLSFSSCMKSFVLIFYIHLISLYQYNYANAKGSA